MDVKCFNLAVFVIFMCLAVFAEKQNPPSKAGKGSRKTKNENHAENRTSSVRKNVKVLSASAVKNSKKKDGGSFKQKPKPFSLDAHDVSKDIDKISRSIDQDMIAAEAEMAHSMNESNFPAFDADELVLDDDDDPFEFFAKHFGGHKPLENIDLAVKKNVAIVPVPFQFEHFNFPKLSSLESVKFPEMTVVPSTQKRPFKNREAKRPKALPFESSDLEIKVIPFNLTELQDYEVKSPDISVVSSGSYKPPELNQEDVEPEWFYPTTKKPQSPQPDATDGNLNDNFSDQREDEVVVEIPGFVNGSPLRFKYLWPKFLGPPPKIGIPVETDSDWSKGKRKPDSNFKAPAAKFSRQKATIKPSLELGANCRNSHQCQSKCCVRLERKKVAVCAKRATKGERCAIGQLKSNTYGGVCPCSAGDGHCVQFKTLDQCDA